MIVITTMVVDSEINFLQCYLSDAPLTSRVSTLAKSHITLDLFENVHARNIMDCILRYQKSQEGVPTPKMLEVMLSQRVKIPEQLMKAVELVQKCERFNLTDWHITECEKWIQLRSTLNAVIESVEQIEKKDLSGVVDRISKAVNIKFDDSIGMSYALNYSQRYNSYVSDEILLPSGMEWIDRVSRGGIPRKTLSCFLSTTTGGFKSGTMCHMACQMYLKGLNVLYVSFELSENAIGERLDANLLDIEIDNLKNLSASDYEAKIKTVTASTKGSLTVKEFAVGGATADNINYIISELSSKGCKPDVVFVDYLNIMASSRIPAKEASNSYHYVKSIAEELRALAQLRDIAIITATQSNRSGLKAGADIGIESTSESHGLPSTLDLYIAIITNEDLEKSNKIGYKQLKNRRRSIGMDPKIYLNVNKAKMRLYDSADSLRLKI
jgi:replicative DNA helicase